MSSIAHPPLQDHEGEESEPGHANVQQVGCSGFLLHLECQTLSRLERGWLPVSLRAGKSQTFALTLSPSHWYPVTFALEALPGRQRTSPVPHLCFP